MLNMVSLGLLVLAGLFLLVFLILSIRWDIFKMVSRKSFRHDSLKGYITRESEDPEVIGEIRKMSSRMSAMVLSSSDIATGDLRGGNEIIEKEEECTGILVELGTECLLEDSETGWLDRSGSSKVVVIEEILSFDS